MGYNVVDRSTENLGSLHQERITLDITTDGALTGLSDNGFEAVAASDETRLVQNPDHAYVAGQENGGYHFSYDHINDQLSVKYADYDAGADGVLIDVPSGTDVGEVELVVVGSS
jgi:hypothetical protein